MVTKSLRWGRYLLLGIVAGSALLVCAPVWMLAQNGGPEPFYILCALIVAPLLVFSLILVKSCRVGEAALAGFLFSLPILVVCLVLPFLGSVIKRDFRAELWIDGTVILVGSVGLSVLVSLLTLRRSE